MTNNKSLFCLSLMVLVLLPGCYKVPTYRSKRLETVSADFAYRGVQENVIVQAKRLSGDDIHALFGQRADQINGSFEAIYISVHNFSPIRYQLCAADIDLIQVSCQNIVQLIKTSSITPLVRVAVSAPIGAGSLYLALISLMLTKGFYESFPMIIPVVGFPLLSLASAGVVLVYSGKFIKSLVMNSRIKKDLKDKMFQSPIAIASGGQYEGLIFVKSSDYSPTFTVTMHEKDNENSVISFDVDVRHNKQ